MPDLTSVLRRPTRHPRTVALAAVAVVLVAGVVAIAITGASLAHLGTLMIGCTALGSILATVLDRGHG